MLRALLKTLTIKTKSKRKTKPNPAVVCMPNLLCTVGDLTFISFEFWAKETCIWRQNYLQMQVFLSVSCTTWWLFFWCWPLSWFHSAPCVCFFFLLLILAGSQIFDNQVWVHVLLTWTKYLQCKRCSQMIMAFVNSECSCIQVFSSLIWHPFSSGLHD